MLKIIKYLGNNIFCFILFLSFNFSLYINCINQDIQERFRPMYLVLYLTVIYSIVNIRKIKFHIIPVQEVLFLILLLLLLISTVLNQGYMGNYALIRLSKMVISFYFTLIILKNILSKLSISQIEFSILSTGMIGCVISLITYVLHFVANYKYGASNEFRLIGIMADDPNLAMFMIVLFFSLCLSKSGFVYSIGLFLSILCVFFSMSRGAYVAVLASAFVSMFLYGQKKLRFKQFFLYFLMIILLFLSIISTPFGKLAMARLSLNSLSRGSGRNIIWKSGMETFEKHYLCGIGFGNTQDYNLKHNSMVFINHNSFLDFFVEGGFIAGGLYLLILIYLTFKILLLVKKNNKYFINSAYLFIALSMFVFISTFLSYGVYRIPYAVFLALIERYSNIRIMDIDSNQQV